MYRQPKRKLRQATRSTRLAPASQDSVSRARAALLSIPAPQAPSQGAIPSLLKADTCTPDSADRDQRNPSDEQPTVGVSLPATANQPRQPHRPILPRLQSLHAAVPVVAFTAIATAAMFFTVRQQVPWPNGSRQSSPVVLRPEISPERASALAGRRETLTRQDDDKIIAQLESDKLGSLSLAQDIAVKPPFYALAPLVHAASTTQASEKNDRLSDIPGPQRVVSIEGAATRTDALNQDYPVKSFSGGLPECLAARSQNDRLASAEVIVLIRTGRQFLANGDVAAARIALRRATGSCDPDAAFALATSYDPRMMKTFGQATVGDVATAQVWYERAKNLGSAEAADQLKRLHTRR
jgi:hypothetical protein